MKENQTQLADFIQKLLRMIEEYPNIVNWGNQGSQFVILNQQQFEKIVLNKFFRHKNIESFVRQLNMYKFHKVCRNKNSINFRNKYFFKGNQANFHLIKRRKKDQNEQQEPVNIIQQSFVQLIKQRHGKQLPGLTNLVEQILKFKLQNKRTLKKLQKSLELLSRQLTEKKSKALKPKISQIKAMISSIEDSGKKTERTLQLLVEQIQNEQNNVKKQQFSSFGKGNITEKEKIQENIAQLNNSVNSYPARHGAGQIYGGALHPKPVVVSSSPQAQNSLQSIGGYFIF